jgi:hypothetical protein
MNDEWIRETSITVIAERIAELETLQSTGLAPADFGIERRIEACRSLLEQLQKGAKAK